MASELKSISTHVLDVHRGQPASGVPVRLERRQPSGEWSELRSARTDHDGRCGQLLPGDDLAPGVYRLVFDTGRYYQAVHVDGLYPTVEITFEVRPGESRFHIPLLLTANGYSTYRGS